MADAAQSRRDLYAGGLMALIGLGAIFEAMTDDVGSLTQMGPGFLPVVLGAVLVGVGAMIALGFGGTAEAADTMAESGHGAIGPLDWRGASAIVAGVVGFIVFGAFAGLVPAIFACVFISALGGRTTTLRGAVILAVSVTLLGTALFSYVLKVPFPLIRW